MKELNRGITLIVLVVTIIVLLILAGISISMLTGQNGILNRASKARNSTEIANMEEKRKIAQAEALMNLEDTTYQGIAISKGFAPTKIEGENSVDEGLVITDGYGNEYVWIEVPKTIEVYQTAGINITNFTDIEYGRIETDLHTYTNDYRDETNSNDVYFEDSTNGWFTEDGETSYDNAKKKMLKSVYQNGGFWVGRYEAGIENEADIRKAASDTVTLIPVTKQNIFPYNYVTRTQAKVLAEKVESGSYTSSLMFGVQWDLVLKYMETKKATTQFNLKTDSRTIGNYRNNLWKITNDNAKYSKKYGNNFTACPNPYAKILNSSILLTTGADTSFSLMNIYDIAGNVWEWTLEKMFNVNHHCSNRGGSFRSTGVNYPASYRDSTSTSYCSYSIGFRLSLY